MTQAILLEDVESLGQRGDPVDVSPGYLRNYLVPRKLAAAATPGALEEAQRRRAAAEKAERERADREQRAASLLSKTVLTIHQRAGDDGKLFGSVTNQDVHRALEERGFTIERRRIMLAEPIKSLGTHDVTVHLGPDTRATIKVEVSALTD